MYRNVSQRQCQKNAYAFNNEKTDMILSYGHVMENDTKRIGVQHNCMPEDTLTVWPQHPKFSRG